MSGWSRRETIMDVLEYNQRLGNGKDGLHIHMRSGAGLANTNPIATQGPAFSSPDLRTPTRGQLHALEAVDLTVGSPSLGTAALVQIEVKWSGEGGMSVDAKILPRARALKPAGQVILFQKIMEDWAFTDQEAATLLGFESAVDIGEIYLGTKPVGHRDANDRLRA